MTATAPNALLLLTKNCPFCPTVLQALSELVKAGSIGRLEVVNIESHPDVAAELGVRSVPWVRLGAFELDGLRSKAELELWAKRAGTREGLADYLNELLSSGGLGKALAYLRRDPDGLAAILLLLGRPETSLHVQVGIGAIMEELRGSDALRDLVDALGELTTRAEPRLRGDACHFLALSEAARAADYVRPLLADPDANVREIAADSLRTLEKHGGGS
jgi:thioredoxin-like negative regulator of GroEL